MLKHFVAIQNFIDKGETKTGLYLPKIIDTINYLVLCICFVKRRRTKIRGCFKIQGGRNDNTKNIRNGWSHIYSNLSV